MADIQQENPVADSLASWLKFLSEPQKKSVELGEQG
jgi:hypothetical protein